MGEWENMVLKWAEWNSLLATAVGLYYLYHVWHPAFILSVIRLVLVLLRQRLSGIWNTFRAKL